MGLDQSGLFFAALTNQVVSKEGTEEPWAMTPLSDVPVRRIVKLLRVGPKRDLSGGNRAF